MKMVLCNVRLTAVLWAVFLAGAVFALEVPSGGGLLISLDATAPDPQLTLAGDTVLGWGPFALMKTNSLPPVADTLGGVRAVRFYQDSDSFLRSADVAPPALTGGGAWTIEVWAFNTNVWGAGTMLSWGDDNNDRDNGRSVSFMYGNSAAAGAVRHGPDAALYNLPWSGMAGNCPATNEWHLLTLTYSGAAPGAQALRLYADGKLVTGRDNHLLDLASGTAFHLGGFFRPPSSFLQKYAGAVARLRILSGALTHAQTLANYQQEAAAFGRAPLAQPPNVFEGTGAWTTPGLWSLGSIPAAGDAALVAGRAMVSSAHTSGALGISGSLEMTGPAAVLDTTDCVTVGYGTGALHLSDGARLSPGVSPEGLSLVVGRLRNGTLTATNTALTVTNGATAVGYTAQDTATADFSNTSNLFLKVTVAQNTGADGTLAQSNGTFETLGSLVVGERGTGRAFFTDTDIAVSSNFFIGYAYAGHGTYVQRGGSLSIPNNFNPEIASSGSMRGSMTLTDARIDISRFLLIGHGGAYAGFAATNSVLNVGHFNLANATPSKADAELYQTSLTALTNVYVGNTARTDGNFTIIDSAVTCQTFNVGHGLNATGHVQLVSGGIFASSTLRLGYNGGTASVSNQAGRIETGILSLAYYETNGWGRLYCGPESVVEVATLDAGRMGTAFVRLDGQVKATTLNAAYESIYSSAEITCGPSCVLQAGRFYACRNGKAVVDFHGTKLLNPDATRHDVIVGSSSSSEGTLNIHPGAVFKMTYLTLANNGGTGTVNQFGGMVTDYTADELDGVQDDGATARTWILGGSMSTAPATTKGIYNLYGGTLSVTSPFWVGGYRTGEMLIAGGDAHFPNETSTFQLGRYTTATGSVRLAGGRLTAIRVVKGSGGAEFFFDGGLLRPVLNRSNFMEGLSKAEVRPGGAKIDTDGHDITIKQSIAHDSRDGAPAKDGGLTKLGAGTLAMTGALGFTGDLGADGGTLDLSAAAYALSSGSGLWGGGALTLPAGGFSIPAGSWIAPGDTNGVGTLTVNGNLTVNGEIRATISSDGTACGTLVSTGSLLFAPGSTLVIQNPEEMEKGVSYTFVTAASVSGTPAIVNLPEPWKLNTKNDQLRAVYNSGTLISVR
jgi:hypothetical protein